MACSKETIRGWLEQGKKNGKTHVMVVCDTYDWEDYPVYIGLGEDVREKYAQMHGPNMQRVMEVYSLSQDIESQLKEHRAKHFD